MSRPTIPKRLRAIFATAEAQGWTVELSRKSHPRLAPPRGLRDADGALVQPVSFALTPSDCRGDKNAIALLRRCGVKGV